MKKYQNYTYTGKYKACSYCDTYYPIGRARSLQENLFVETILNKESNSIKKIDDNKSFSLSEIYISSFYCSGCNSLHVRKQQSIMLNSEIIYMRTFKCGKCKTSLIEFPIDLDYSRHKCSKCNSYFQKNGSEIEIIE